MKVGPSYEIKIAPRGCAARGMENIALRTARARRISQARFFFIVRLAAQRKRGYERRIDDVIPTEQRKRGYERWIDDVIPTEQRKCGYERRIDDVIPMNAENAWIWQVETNVNLKKADIL